MIASIAKTLGFYLCDVTASSPARTVSMSDLAYVLVAYELVGTT